ncbi:Uncharacterised protein [uncultured archaeon]|nr:Uncharacterised protein [uncultured archaeon]
MKVKILEKNTKDLKKEFEKIKVLSRKKVSITDWNDWISMLKSHKNLIILSMLFLISAILINYASGFYVDHNTKTVSANDLLLDFLPSIDISPIFIYGAVIIVALFFLYPLLFRLEEFHKAVSQFSLLILVRSFFIILTHLSLPLDAIAVHAPNFLSFLNVQNDLFFSGHTSIPFLGFLLFKNKKIKYFFLVSSIVMAVTVLLMHVHYTIDVLSAYFITYGVFKFGEKFYEKIK